MVVEVKRMVCDGRLLKWLAGAGLSWLEHNEDMVNSMNVFPVPDGDTGTNMVLTMRKACAEITHMNESNVGEVVEAIARGALMGARGNSGVILSQLWHGFAQGIKGYEVFGAEQLIPALQSAVDAGYNAVVEPVEGTILTVARMAVEAAVEKSQHETDLLVLLDTIVDAARSALMKTPTLLPVLKEAGVVDSGGMGLIFMLEGMQRLLKGEKVNMKLESRVSANGHHWQEALVPEDKDGYGYDVQFLIHGANLDVEKIRADIDAMGWSTLVVGDQRLIKVHVHVHDPGKPISYAIGLGAAIDDVVVENMQQQYEEYVEERLTRESRTSQNVEGVAVVTVVSGEGMRQLFMRELQAAHVISGGQTMNPSTQDFLAAIDSLSNTEIILLPNNKNIIMAAKQAASMSPGKRVHVVESRNVPQGISAMFAYLNMSESTDGDEIVSSMQNALSEVISCEVTTATRDATFDGVKVREGQFIGLVNGKLVVAGDNLLEVARGALLKSHADEHELISVYYGAQVNSDQAQSLVDVLAADYAHQEFVIIEGGQPLYPYIISVE
jgi:DAK2 domain fusion protein YloV